MDLALIHCCDAYLVEADSDDDLGGAGGPVVGSLFGNEETNDTAAETETVSETKDESTESCSTTAIPLAAPPSAVTRDNGEEKKTRVVMARQQSAESPSQLFKLQVKQAGTLAMQKVHVFTTCLLVCSTHLLC